MRYSNWPNTLLVVYGTSVIINLFRLSKINLLPWLPDSFYLWLSIIILLIGVIWIVIKYYKKKEKNDFKVDERYNAVADRSGRNGLLVTYFALFILLLTDFPLNEKSMLIVITVGLIAWAISFVFLYYKKA
jgi:predicted histidine transporter YuiF (NhaC family)